MLINPETIDFKYIKISELFGKKYYFPIFQRFYAWKAKHVDELLNDLKNAMESPEKEIYLLDFIWFEEDEKIYFADGQQRIVTVNMLIKVINEIIDDKKLDVEKLNYIDVEYDCVEYTEKYNEAFNNYMKAPFKNVYVRLDKFAKEEIETNQIKDLVEILKNRTRVYMREVSGIENAFTIFSQINTGGKPLTKGEIIKTTIDQYAKMYDVKIEYKSQAQLVKQIQAYYKFVVDRGYDFDIPETVHFLRTYITSDREKFEKFAKYIKIMETLEKNSLSMVIEYIRRGEMQDIMNVMAMKGIDLNVQRDYLDKIMIPLCLLSIIATMHRGNPGGIIKRLFSDIINAIKNDAKIKDIQMIIATFANENPNICKITYDDFVAGLGGNSILGRKCKEALLIIDIIRSNVSSDVNMKRINLEHIYPNKPSYTWAINGWPTSAEEQKEFNTNIGDFIILNEPLNKQIKNKYLDVKVPEYKKIIKKDLSLQTEINTIDYSRFETEKGDYIKERQEKIAKAIYDGFELAPVLIVK